MIIKLNKDWIRKLTEKYPILHYIFKWNDGLDFEAEEKDDQDETKHVLGADTVVKVLVPNSDWTPFWTANEKQKGAKIESMACTVFSFVKCICALAKNKYGEDWDKSERFTAKMSGVSRSGNVMSKVADSGRKLHGLLNQAIYPNQIDEVTWHEFYKFIPQEMRDQALVFLEEYEIKYKKIGTSLSAIKDGLRYSPIWCAGYAWYKRGNEYISFGRANHAFTIKRIENGKRIVGDSYDPFEKTLADDYRIYYPKILILNKKFENERDRMMKEGTMYVVFPHKNGEFYKLTKEKLEYIPTQDKINEEISKHTDLSQNLQELTKQKKVMWLPNEYYDKLSS